MLTSYPLTIEGYRWTMYSLVVLEPGSIISQCDSVGRGDGDCTGRGSERGACIGVYRGVPEAAGSVTAGTSELT